MSDVVIVDTSVLLNVLNVPGCNDHHAEVHRQFERFLTDGATLMLPLAVVFETGNHIADVPSGGDRRRFALLFRDEVRKALREEAPWHLVPLPDASHLTAWLESFPDQAVQRISLSDHSMIQLWKSLCKKLFDTRVLIWSMDDKLRACDRKP